MRNQDIELYEDEDDVIARQCCNRDCQEEIQLLYDQYVSCSACNHIYCDNCAEDGIFTCSNCGNSYCYKCIGEQFSKDGFCSKDCKDESDA